MKKFNTYIFCCFFVASGALIIGSGDSSNSSSPSKSTSKSNIKKTINGVYSYSDNSAKSTITVSGTRWSGKLIIITGFGSSYDNSNASYNNGIVKDGILYDDSGWVELGSANGTSLTMPIGSSRVTHYK